MRRRWPAAPTDEEFEEFVTWLRMARLALPRFSIGKLVQASIIAKVGYWPGTLLQLTNTDLTTGLQCLVPHENEDAWTNEEEMEEV